MFLVPTRLSLSLFALLSACSGADPVWSQCVEADCWRATVEAQYAQSPQTVLRFIRQDADPLLQLALVEQLATAHPRDMPELCADLPQSSPAAMRCDKLKLRPHLYDVPPDTMDVVIRRAGSGPVGGDPSAYEGGAAGSLLPDKNDAEIKACGVDTSCLRELAHKRANDGDADLLADTCAASWPVGAARDECFFQAAEDLALAIGPSSMKGALTLCNAAGSLARPCARHALVYALPAIPPADQVVEADVLPLIASVELVRSAVGGAQGDEYAHWIWSGWIQMAYAHADTVTTHLLALLPVETLPHVRVAAAWRLLDLEGVNGRSMDQIVDRLTRLPAPPVTVSPDREVAYAWISHSERLQQHWRSDQGEIEGALDAVWCLQSGRRALGRDDTDDLRISVLEAAARLSQPPDAPFYLQVLHGDYDERVRWTAARLLSEQSRESVGDPPDGEKSALVLGVFAPRTDDGRGGKPRKPQ